MVDILKRSLAPITAEAWAEIDEQAKRTLTGNLSARAVVDFDGPHGWELGAVNLGRLKIEKKQSAKEAAWGLREVQPLIEIRTPLKLGQMELDSISRGVKNPDLGPLEEAARKVALFEENTLYYGLKEACIIGIAEGSTHGAIPITKKAGTYQEVVENAITALQKAGVGGPYDLTLGDAPYQAMMAGDEKGYPLRKRLEELIGGSIRWSPVVKGGLLVSRRGGDYEMTVGQDLSIGYCSHDRGSIEFYITETFTFRVLEPAAAVELKLKAN
jgi:uncharacterized linocin/CFP29 family protein